LRNGVGLGKNCRTGLLQNLIAGQLGRFGCEVSIHDPATGCRQVLHIILQIGDDGLETVLHRAVSGAQVGYLGDIGVQLAEGCGGATGGSDVDGARGGEAATEGIEACGACLG